MTIYFCHRIIIGKEHLQINTISPVNTEVKISQPETNSYKAGICVKVFLDISSLLRKNPPVIAFEHFCQFHYEEGYLKSKIPTILGFLIEISNHTNNLF